MFNFFNLYLFSNLFIMKKLTYLCLFLLIVSIVACGGESTEEISEENY